MALLSCSPVSFQMLQCTTEKGWRIRRLMSSADASASSMISCTMGGGSMTRRSRSPKPHDRAATGCCRTRIVYSDAVDRAGLGMGALEELRGETATVVTAAALGLSSLSRLVMDICLASVRGEAPACTGGLAGGCGGAGRLLG